LHEYAVERRIRFREDASNLSLDIPRNRIRHELLPLLAASYATDVVPALARVARLARERDGLAHERFVDVAHGRDSESSSKISQPPPGPGPTSSEIGAV
jgi:tRNA(Ile)-lysidine synthase TilS/MesJ